MNVKKGKRKRGLKKPKFSEKVSEKMLDLVELKLRQIAEKRGVKIN
ncbi:MAG: hypothetical protein V1928_01820 [Parcubacteria group bacterium]